MGGLHVATEWRLGPGERAAQKWCYPPPHPPLSTRYERLEEQLNDLTELHQNEMTNLKQELASMEEKVAYQSYERARDIQVRPGSPWEGHGKLIEPVETALSIGTGYR